MKADLLWLINTEASSCLFHKEGSFADGPLTKNIPALLVTWSVLSDGVGQGRAGGVVGSARSACLGPCPPRGARTALSMGRHNVRGMLPGSVPNTENRRA